VEQAPEYSAAPAPGDVPRVNQKKSVQRTCVGCGARREQREMLRIAAVPGAAGVPGAVPVVDNVFKAPGRGAYLCREVACIEKALKRRAIERSLKLKSGVPASLRDDIMKKC